MHDVKILSLFPGQSKLWPFTVLCLPVWPHQWWPACDGSAWLGRCSVHDICPFGHSPWQNGVCPFQYHQGKNFRNQTEKNVTSIIYMQLLLYGNLIAMANQNDFYIHSLLRCGIHNLYSRFIMYATPATRTNLFSQLCLINHYRVCQINSVLI